MKMYRPIMKASKKSPELAEVLKEDLKLKGQRKELLEEIKYASDEGEKEQLKNQLEQLVAERFELIIKRKQARYEQLLQRLENLKKQVEMRKNEVDTLKSQKADKVKERVRELLSDTEKINWD
jgi:DNA repair exonuclease SbcCD ATPase subunit